MNGSDRGGDPPEPSPAVTTSRRALRRGFRPAPTIRDLSGYFRRLGRLTPNARRYLFGSFLLGIGHGAAWVHLNLYFRALGLGEGMIGRILSAQALGTVVIAVPVAVWIDRVPARRVFGISAAGYTAMFATVLLARHPAVLVGAMFCAGALFTVHMVAAAPFFMRNAAPEERIYLFGFAQAIETLATIGSAVGAGALAQALSTTTGSELLGLRWALLAVAVLTFGSVFFYARIQGDAPVRERRSIRSYLLARDWSLLVKLTLPVFIVGMGAGLIIPFLNLYFRERFGQDPRQIGGFFAVSQFLTMVGFLLGPVLARRIGSVMAVVATEALSIPFFLVLAFTDHLHLAVLAFWMRGALMNMNHPISTNFSMEVVADDQQTVTNSLRMLAWNVSWMMSTQIGGWLIQSRGFTPPMLITIVLYAVSALLFYLFFRDRLSVGRAVRA